MADRLGKFTRLLALLALLAGLLGAVTPGTAMPAATPGGMHDAMGCGGGHHPPAGHPSGAADCCVSGICAMNLALPVAPSGIALPFHPKTRGYDLRALRQPPGIVTAPIPHPPKSAA